MRIPAPGSLRLDALFEIGQRGLHDLPLGLLAQEPRQRKAGIDRKLVRDLGDVVELVEGLRATQLLRIAVEKVP
jgi:hypothetical protein